jgi:aldose 1-epimerase
MKQAFGVARNGAALDLYTLSNPAGMRVQITNYGGIVTSLLVPDRNGWLGDLVLGFDRIDGYLEKHPYFGAICGRYANRIADGRFTLAGVEYALARNDGRNHLHGGVLGFDKMVWEATELAPMSGAALRLEYSSPAGDEGYPGNLDVVVTYTLTDANELRIDYLATSDAETVLNLSHHGYFNLADGGKNDVSGHEVTIEAARFLPIDAALIPTGELRDVRGTPMDFTRATAIGARIDAAHEQLLHGRGYDHTWVVNGAPGQLRLAARVFEPSSGRVMEVLTTEPGVQFYTGNFLDGTLTGKGGAVYRRRHGLCLECQHFPDSPNKPQFPSTVIKPGEQYTQTTVYRFSVA